MTATIDITCSLPAPTLVQVRAWLTSAGWVEDCVRKRSSVWWHPSARCSSGGREGVGLTQGGLAATIAEIAGVLTRARGAKCTPEAVYREIMGPVRIYEAVTYDALGRTSLGFYASRESAPQGDDVSIEEHEVRA